MILCNKINESAKNIVDLSDFDDIEADDNLDICRSIFAAEEDSLESDEVES